MSCRSARKSAGVHNRFANYRVFHFNACFIYRAGVYSNANTRNHIIADVKDVAVRREDCFKYFLTVVCAEQCVEQRICAGIEVWKESQQPVAGDTVSRKCQNVLLLIQ